jgi:hypothetical protein
MAYLLTNNTIRARKGKLSNQDSDVPDYLVVSSCGYRQWRVEPLADWLNRQTARKKGRAIPALSPVFGKKTG